MFDYNDLVRIKSSFASATRSGEKAWIIGVIDQKDRKGAHFDAFPPGCIYAVEFEDGTSVDVHEADVEPYPKNE